ncbi:hypothetical protein GUJ93_ZPchr0008g12935 [Zizania palustris]|uniref:Uncharacterized protein n=1 Tax=Zizania palustris TaxID=103762 RepID=A0A8J5RLX4_ZIZPA|nr:hypothetical protein GUJ93_ZPchr0008g12935 [Zizania palustris]
MKNRYRYEEMLGEDGVYTMTWSSTKATASCATEGEQRVLPILLGTHSASPAAFIPIPRKPPGHHSPLRQQERRLPPAVEDTHSASLSAEEVREERGTIVRGGGRLRRPADERRETEGNGSGGGRKDEHHNHSC